MPVYKAEMDVIGAGSVEVECCSGVDGLLLLEVVLRKSSNIVVVRLDIVQDFLMQACV